MKRVHVVTWFFLALLSASVADAQNTSTCPKGLPEGTRCLTGKDKNEAYYLIAVPQNWNGTLTLHCHGGFSFARPTPLEARSLGPSRLLLKDGVAVAASSYRTLGFAASVAAEDTENLRRLFVEKIGPPRQTFVSGPSYGALVAARAVELYGVSEDGSLNYSGALPMCGAVAGMRRIGYLMLDLRVVYQYYCQNLPLPKETQYPLYLGLDPWGPSRSKKELVNELYDRWDECTGFRLKAEERSDEQRRNFRNILAVTTIPEREFPQMMYAATAGLLDLAIRLNWQNAFPWRNAFSNVGVKYTGSDDDDALNAGVSRYASDPEAVSQLSSESDPTGKVSIPVITMHTIGDGRTFVENESAYREAFEAAGTVDHLFQTYTDAENHCQFSNSEYAAVFQVLRNWIDRGEEPSQEGVIKTCEDFRSGNRDQCRFDPTYRPKPYESRVPAREP